MTTENPQFRIARADWERDQDALRQVRHQVFVIEQDIPLSIEWDGMDEQAVHVMAADADGRPIGTARLLNSGQIGRMAVLEEWRGHGVGAALLDQAIECARELGMSEVFLHSNASATGFYARIGFIPEGPPYDEANILHQTMRLVF